MRREQDSVDHESKGLPLRSHVVVFRLAPTPVSLSQDRHVRRPLPICVQQLKESLVIDGFVALVPVNHPDNSEIFALFLNELLRDNRC